MAQRDTGRCLRMLTHKPYLVSVDQVRWAKWSLERVRVKAGRGEAGRPLEHGDVLAQQLSHFVNTLHQFVMDRLLQGAWLELQQVSLPPVYMLGLAACLQALRLHLKAFGSAQDQVPDFTHISMTSQIIIIIILYLYLLLSHVWLHMRAWDSLL